MRRFRLQGSSFPIFQWLPQQTSECAFFFTECSRKFTECSNNSRDTWKTLNSLIRYKNASKDVILNHGGSTVSDPSAIAEVFNNYFSNVASNLDRNIPHADISPLNFLGAPVENSFFCSPSDREEIVNLHRRQKNKSTDLMNIPVFIYI